MTAHALVNAPAAFLPLRDFPYPEEAIHRRARCWSQSPRFGEVH
jgi:hypothetical protein